MNPTAPRCAALVLALGLAACAGPGGTPPPPAAPRSAGSVEFPASQPGKRRVIAEVVPGISVDYTVERKFSELNAQSCYSFITGALINNSPQTLSRRTVLDITVFSRGKQLFRDITQLADDVAPGRRVMFNMISSPVHRNNCPDYDRVSESMHKILAD